MSTLVVGDLHGKLDIYKEIMEEGADNPWENGVTHTDRNGRFWSGNFRGWIQNRQLLEDWNG